MYNVFPNGRRVLSSTAHVEVKVNQICLNFLFIGKSLCKRDWHIHNTLWQEKEEMQNVYSNLYSQAVTHPSTNRSQPCLTSVIGRELVYSRWYGRRHWSSRQKSIAWSKSAKQLKESCPDEGQSWVFCFTLMPLSADLVGQPANLFILVQSLTGLDWIQPQPQTTWSIMNDKLSEATVLASNLVLTTPEPCVPNKILLCTLTCLMGSVAERSKALV